MRHIDKLNIYYLCPEEREKIDWTGAGFNWIKAFPGTGRWSGKPSKFYTKEPEWFIENYYSKILSNLGTKHTPYINYVNELRSKVVQQGGMFGLDQMKDMAKLYYDHVPNSIHPDRWLLLARDYIIKSLKLHVDAVGLPQDVPIKFGTTQAALPTFYHKCDFQARSAYDANSWSHIMDNICGQRISDKDRIIFMDALENFSKYQPSLTKVREWLKREYPDVFDAWRNPNISMNKRITKYLDSGYTSIELDYKKMDQWFSWPLVKTFLLPIYEVLLTPGEYLRFAQLTEEYFKQPLYWGDSRWTGEHTLFSGIPPTNDFETLWDWILSKALELASGIEIIPFILGDDMSLLAKCSLEQAKYLVQLAIDMTRGVNLLLHDDEKNRVVQGEFRFLKRLYYLGGLRDYTGTLISAYPGNILLRNVLMPERPINQSGVAACADLQRCDGLYGSPDYTPVVQMLMSRTKHSFMHISPEDVEAFSENDWWVKLYGEKWDPACSLTYQQLRKMNLSGPNPYYTDKYIEINKILRS